jgi:hypothetical protein
LTVAVIRERGWSVRLIRETLGEPDATRTNPHNRSGPPVKLYRRERVEDAERQPRVREYLAGRPRRAERAKRAAQTRCDGTLAAIAALPIAVEAVPLSELRRRAIAAWEARNCDSAKGVDETTIQRWMVNHARHHLTAYDRTINALVGQTGRVDAVKALRRRIYGAIAAAYPALANECDRQARAREGA